ncbi:hypothetical protein Q7C36_008347 [Tachysurus vachellii]|uniref:Uncharacterized protein n=1 Tax=Tachysurus vachellii TaxID=175792 RepID=A0AA88ND82_TACVA|nr:uncharacterized protein LOC132846865 [Tachysurus vachellii]KAK2853146.1 hypothetical protein Q7C36_008347 [Tachysurus vachellii]
MSKDSHVFEVYPDTEGILSVKKDLEKKSREDNVLLSNLDFSESVFRHNPLNKAMTLQVKGQWQCLRIGKDHSLIYTVSSEDQQTRIDCCVYCDNDKIESSDIKSIHFSVHSCQNQSRSCFTAAKAALESGDQALKITCNRFSITYTTHGVPDDIKLIQTKCQFNLLSVTAEALLERKCWMQKEKKNCKELIDCMSYLVQKYLTSFEVPKSNCRFILQGDKEMVEIISEDENSEPTEEYVVIYEGYSKVRVYPPLE